MVSVSRPRSKISHKRSITGIHLHYRCIPGLIGKKSVRYILLPELTVHITGNTIILFYFIYFKFILFPYTVIHLQINVKIRSNKKKCPHLRKGEMNGHSAERNKTSRQVKRRVIRRMYSKNQAGTGKVPQHEGQYMPRKSCDNDRGLHEDRS